MKGNIIRKIVNRVKLLGLYSFRDQVLLVLWQIKLISASHVRKQLWREYEALIALTNRKAIVTKKKGSVMVKYRIGGFETATLLKLGTSDLLVYNQIMINEEYKNVIDIFKSEGLPLRTFVDAGANIGLTTLYLKAFFPEATGVALEPSTETCERLNKNLQLNDTRQVTVLKKGLWSRNAQLKGDTSFRDGLDWAFRLVETSGDSESIDAVSVPQLMKDTGLKIIDFFKIDIEGGEAELFKDGVDLSWLQSVNVLAVEIHDELNMRAHIENVLTTAGFQLSYSGELTIAVRKKEQVSDSETDLEKEVVVS